jgi:hypothetical protein
VAPEAFGQFGVGEGPGLTQGVGEGGVGAGQAAGLCGAGPGGRGFSLGFGNR